MPERRRGWGIVPKRTTTPKRYVTSQNAPTSDVRENDMTRHEQFAPFLIDEGSALEGATGPRARTSDDPRVIVIGGGQSGLSAGYHLKRQGIPFVIHGVGRDAARIVGVVKERERGVQESVAA